MRYIKDAAKVKKMISAAANQDWAKVFKVSNDSFEQMSNNLRNVAYTFIAQLKQLDPKSPFINQANTVVKQLDKGIADYAKIITATLQNVASAPVQSTVTNTGGNQTPAGTAPSAATVPAATPPTQ